MTATTSKLGADMTDDDILRLAAQVLGNPLLFEDLKQDFTVHTEAGEWIKFARALLARQPAAIDKQDERGAFEQALKAGVFDEDRLSDYSNCETEAAWRGWQARATPSVEQDERVHQFAALCGLLPSDVSWGDPLMPDIARHIARAASTSANVAQPLSIMRKAFRVTETEGNPDPEKQRFHMRFTFRSMEELHAADDQWRAFVSSSSCSSANVAQGAVAPDGRVVDKAMVKRLAVQYGLLPEQTADVAQGAEAVRQLEQANGSWIDVSKDAYDSTEAERRRIVYTAPPAQTALTDDAQIAKVRAQIAAIENENGSRPKALAARLMQLRKKLAALTAAQSASGDTK